MEYTVKAETFEGNVMTLRRGFSSEEAAEDHPVQMSLWKRVWVEAIPEAPPTPPPALPPLPWTVDVVDGEYGGKTTFTYIKVCERSPYCVFVRATGGKGKDGRIYMRAV